MTSVESTGVLDRFLEEIEVESIGWTPYEPVAYFLVSDPDAIEILIVGLPQTGAAALLLD